MGLPCHIYTLEQCEIKRKMPQQKGLHTRNAPSAPLQGQAAAAITSRLAVQLPDHGRLPRRSLRLCCHRALQRRMRAPRGLIASRPRLLQPAQQLAQQRMVEALQGARAKAGQSTQSSVSAEVLQGQRTPRPGLPCRLACRPGECAQEERKQRQEAKATAAGKSQGPGTGVPHLRE